MTRGIDLNQVRIFDNGFLDDFQRAQRNLAANGDPTVGERLHVFPLLGRFRARAGALRRRRNPQSDRDGAGRRAGAHLRHQPRPLPHPGRGAAVELTPGFFLRANPSIYVADYVGNGSYSTYHGLRPRSGERLQQGLYLQGNYTFSKGFTDFEGGQTNFQGLLDLGSTVAVEKTRISNDITHVIKANGIYELPFGPGKRFLDGGGFAGKSARRLEPERAHVGCSRASRSRSSRSAGRSTAPVRSVKNTVNTQLSVPRSCRSAPGSSGLAGAPRDFRPEPHRAGRQGEHGVLPEPGGRDARALQLTPVSGPWFFNVDMSVIKRTAITESANVEFRAEAFNIFNRTNFFLGAVGQAQNINNTTFGRITQTFDPRVLQFALKIQFLGRYRIGSRGSAPVPAPVA